jgi:anti-sigma regulatory factor (Ser/Thr protein kinase)
LQGWGIPRDTVADAVLLVSELVTNALLHARSAPSVEVTYGVGVIRCDVIDNSPLVPRRRHYANDAVTGRGIALVEALAARWGSERDGVGKRVWFELDVDDARDGLNVNV